MMDKEIVKRIEVAFKMYPFMLISFKDKALIEKKTHNSNHRVNEDYKMLTINMEKAMGLLSNNEREFLELRYFKDWTIVKIALEMNYSEQMLFRIRKKLIGKMYFALYPFLKDDTNKRNAL